MRMIRPPFKRELTRVLLTCYLALAGLAGCAPAERTTEADRAFRETVAAPVNQKLEVQTDKAVYTDDDEVHLWISNETGATLYFSDQSFGLRAFRYDQSAERWEPFSLGFTVGDPYRKKVLPDSHLLAEISYSFATHFMQFEGDEAWIRLLVSGYSQPLELGGGEQHAAYTDIHIQRR